MYVVPMDIPKCCNECPFGHCTYSFPLGSSSISDIDGKEDRAGTYGYVCNIEFQANGKYTKVLRAERGESIKKPQWCGLQEIEERGDLRAIGEQLASYGADKIARALEKQEPYKIVYENGFGYCKCGCEYEREGYEGEEYCLLCGQKVWVGGYNGEKSKVVKFGG